MKMMIEWKETLAAPLKGFRLPRYQEIPAVGLYLEQTTNYITKLLAPLQENCITGSMISNYVKKRLISSPEKKQYSREQIAYLIFITVAKNVLSLDNLKQFIQIQRETYSSQKAYDYFCDEMENILFFVFGLKDRVEAVGQDSSDEKFMLRNAIIAVAHKLYLEKCFQVMRTESICEKGETV